jgi:transposase-like protein
MPENKPSKRRTYTREFKLKVLGEIEAGKSQAQAARDYQLTEIAIYKWRQQLKKYKEHAFAGQGKAYTDEARLHELERMVGLNPGSRSQAMWQPWRTVPRERGCRATIRDELVVSDPRRV